MFDATLSYRCINFICKYARPCVCVMLLSILVGCQLPLGKRGIQDVTQVRNPCIVLALPASGPYAPIATKIRQGAETARNALVKQGIQVDLRNINTEASDWLTQLNALPEACAIVGGPLQDKKYIEARNTGILEKRAFFSFLPSLAKGDEGKHAWRFFPSQQDQIDALVNLVTDHLSIRTYGSFYPADNYGRRMSDMLEKNLAKRHIPLQKAAYNPSAPATWAASARSLIQPKMAEDGKTTVPQTAFEAILLPDSWKHMDGVTDSLRANGEDRLILLGTTLWEQGLQARRPARADRYELAIFPVAWNRANVPAAMRKGNYNFWTALGFDFINFAGHMGLAARPNIMAITQLAQANAARLQAMAPISWDKNGIGHQHMFIYQITSAGITPANLDRIRRTKTTAAEKAALRMQGWGHIDPDTGEALATPASEPVGKPVLPQAPAGSEPVQTQQAAEKPRVATSTVAAPAGTPSPAVQPAPAPVSGVPGVMSSTPRPSYKLSLPVRQ